MESKKTNDFKDEKKDQDDEYEGSKNILEWAVFAVGLIIILAILSYLSYKTYTHQPSPAEIEIQYTLSPSDNVPYRFHVIAYNRGGETAESVIVELELQNADTTMEMSEITFQFVPQSSKREGFIIFRTDPAEADSIFARVVSFNKP